MFKAYTYSLLNDKIIIKSKQIFKSDCHNVDTEQINKIAPSSNDDKRLQTHLIKFKHIHMKQMHLKYVKARC